MPVINAYLDKLETRFTESKMMLADVVTLPHMKSSQRNATVNKWMKTLNMHDPKAAKPASKARLKMMGIGVRYVG